MAAPMVKTATPGIYKRGSRYVVSYRVDGRQKWESAGSLAEARKLKAARVTAIDAGEFAADSKIKFRDYAEEWIERYHGRGRGFRETTRAAYRRSLNTYVLPAIGHIPISKLTTRTLNQFLADMAKVERDGTPLAESTIRNALNPIRACLATAVDEGLIRYNPTRGVYIPKCESVDAENSRESRAFTQNQLETVLALVHPEYRDLFELLAATGLRISEAIGLQWKHLDLDGARPEVRIRRALVRGAEHLPKSKTSRRQVPLSPALVDRLRARRAGMGEGKAAPDRLVFPNRNGQPLNDNNVRARHLAPVLAEAGVDWKGAGYHTFRHTCASMLFARGRNVKQVQEWLGHHSPGFTLDTYVHLMDDGVGEGLDIREGANKVQTHQLETTGSATFDEVLESALLSGSAVAAGTPA